MISLYNDKSPRYLNSYLQQTYIHLCTCYNTVAAKYSFLLVALQHGWERVKTNTLEPLTATLRDLT